MTKKRIIIVSSFIAAITFVGLWMRYPSSSYDIERVEPRLRLLQSPYQAVKLGYAMDGGSIGIEIIDRDGRREQFAIPAHLGDTNPYAKVFVGAMHDRRPGAIEVADSANTKLMLIQIIADMPQRTPSDDYCLMMLRRRSIDFARCLVNKWTKGYQP